MKTKVTLSLDADFVKEAKRFAQSEKRSLSAQVMESVRKDLEEKAKVKKQKLALIRLEGRFKLLKETEGMSLDELKSLALRGKYEN